MSSDEKAKELHDRATRGESLTPEEQTQLNAWYDNQDQAEFQRLGLTGAAADNAVLHDQIKVALEQLATATAQIQKLVAENDALRRENLTLRRQLSEQPLLQHA